MHKKVKFKGPSGFMVECILSFNSHNSVNVHPIEKNMVSKFKLGSRLFKAKSISEIEQKTFVLLLIKCRTFFGTPGRYIGCFFGSKNMTLRNDIEFGVQA